MTTNRDKLEFGLQELGLLLLMKQAQAGVCSQFKETVLVMVCRTQGKVACSYICGSVRLIREYKMS